MEKRTIIHVDMDAFFASVEQMDNPKLKGKPIIVSGEGARSVVSTCSYEARKYGVHSAMPSFVAKQLCPIGIFLPVRHRRYSQVSKEIFNILKSISQIVEPVSIDEAYLDVSFIDIDPLIIVNQIKREIKKRYGLTLSAGISYNKFLAKIASDWNKPDGLMVITEKMIPEILEPLPVKKVHGIGVKSIKKLNAIGIYTIRQLMRLTEEEMIYYFGKLGIEIYNRIRGIDNRQVSTEREIKSIGRETTFEQDTKDKNYLRKILMEFALDVQNNLKKESLYAKTVSIKLKTEDFKSYTRSKTLKEYIRNADKIINVAFGMLNDYSIKKSIRLIGLSVSNIGKMRYEQLTFFDNDFKIKTKT